MLKQIISFFEAMGEYLSPDDGEGVGYHRVIVAAGGVVGAAFSLIGLCLLVSLAGEEEFRPKYLLRPVVFFMMGAVFGTATACTFAPGRFLRGAAGRKWMRLIGTESVAVARMVCVCFMMLFLGFVGMMAWAAWSDYQRGML
jgi:hypothetical protein